MANPRGRQAGFVMSDEHRTKIANAQFLNRLIAHANGENEMTPTQVQAANILLKKVLPDLQAVQLSGDGDNPLNVIHRIERAIVDPKG